MAGKRNFYFEDLWALYTAAGLAAFGGLMLLENAGYYPFATRIIQIIMGLFIIGAIFSGGITLLGFGLLWILSDAIEMFWIQIAYGVFAIACIFLLIFIFRNIFRG